jgi:DNA polymerase (family X)
MSLNQELSRVFAEMAAILEIKGANPFKAIAFSKVSRILKDMTMDIRRCCEEGTLGELEGIGASSRKIIEEYVKTGRSTEHDELAVSVPAGLLPLLEIPGMGPKTIALLWKERGVTSLDELKAAIETGALKGLKGLGEKKIAAIREGIEFRATAGQRLGIGHALPVAAMLLERLRGVAGVKRAEIAGSLRRRRETIGDVDLVCAVGTSRDRKGVGPAQPASADEVVGREGRGDKETRRQGEPSPRPARGQSPDPLASPRVLGEGEAAAVAGEFVKFPEVARILGQGSKKASIVTASGLQVDLRMVPEESFGAALMYFTGSKDHNVRVRGLAQSMGMTLNEWGLFEDQRHEGTKARRHEVEKAVAGGTEGEIYRKLGMDYVEPELREDRGEVEAAREGRLPVLIERGDIRGDLHTHTTASDGVNSILEMAEAAKRLGYEYLAITDHSKSQVIANGLTADRLMKHVAAIRKAGERLKGITLLAGCEVDILADGHLDFEDAVLAELDWVVASPHVALKQPEAKATARILRAIENRYVNVIGHPTGRVINSRAGLPLDFGRIFKAAAETGTALEINAGYPRLDLDEVNSRGAMEAGAMLSINTDAHAVEEFENMPFGLGVARRAWGTKGHVINCMTLKELRRFLNRKR